MPCNFETDIFEKLGQLVERGGLFTQATGDDECYSDFISDYPAKDISKLTIDQYCMGKDAMDGNFSWWIERGLEKVLGRYSPGSARGHILYKKKDGSIYQQNVLKDLSVRDALHYALAVQAVIANADMSSDVTWIDDETELCKRAGVESRPILGNGRKLRILSAYHPDQALVISSSEHLEHFLSQLGHPAEEIPEKDRPVARMLLLKKYYEEAKRRFNAELTPYGFMKALYSDDLGVKPIKKKTDEEDAMELMDPDTPVSLNQILFGPPGTGKTFSTTALAVKITDPEWYAEQYENLDWKEFFEVVKGRYDELVHQKQIVFTTFHQSFAYEDFIEGIRATTDDKTKQIRYEIQDGVFKQICDSADVRVTLQSSDNIDLTGRRIWKMSLGNTLEDDDTIYQECLESGYALLGYGGGIDFKGCDKRSEVKSKIEKETGEIQEDTSYSVTAVHNFKNVIKPNDILVISDGNQKFRAIGEFSGDYQFLGNDDRSGYQQMRSVKWLRQYEPSLPIEQLFKKSLSQMTLYELRPKTIDHDKLSQLLTPEGVEEKESRPHVLIIDEINRGNISRIFGELITLLEHNKRKNSSDARWVTLPYSKKAFSVPDNLYVIGTMNTADKSLAQLDLALRRRFTFIDIPPNPDLLSDLSIYKVNVAELLTVINQRIEVLLDKDHLIGHSYFWSLHDKKGKSELEDALSVIFRQNIIPLLQEYFFDDWVRIGWVLNDPDKKPDDRFIQNGGDKTINSLFSRSIAEQLGDRRYQVNESAFDNAASYQGIIQVKT